MGQSASSQREREEFLQRDSRRFSQLVRDRAGRDNSQTDHRLPAARLDLHSHTLSSPPVGLSHQQESQSTTPFATFSRQISAQSIPARGATVRTTDAAARDSIFYQQHEERPLVHMEELGMRNAPITNITATPMPRRAPIFSRIGSRLISRSTQPQNMDSGAGDYTDASTFRRRLSRSFSSRQIGSGASASSHRLSMFSSISTGSSTLPRPRRRRDRAPISPPIPLTEDDSLPSSTTSASAREYVAPSASTSHIEYADADDDESVLPRESRLSRIRRSLSTPLESLLATTRIPGSQHGQGSVPSQRPSGFPTTNDPDYFIPPLTVADATLDLQDPSLSSTAPTTRDNGMHGFPTVSETTERLQGRSDNPSWTERWTERSSGGRRESRRMPSMLRGRSSRLIRRDDEGPLPRILHLAAAAIAAQLSGTPEQAFNNTHAIGAEGLDGSLATLFRTLQLATASTTDFRSPEGSNETPRLPGSQTPLNFLRVFRFIGTNTNERFGARAGNEDESGEDNLEGPEGRIVTLVMVGVRSVPSDHIGEDALNAEPTLDTLLNLPTGPANNILRHGSGGLLRHADGRSRFPRRRRASMGGVNPFPANYDSQRHQRMHSASRQGSLDTTAVSSSAMPLVLSESPPGPHPPPSTPADPGLSAYSSGTTTPNRRPSSASALQHPPLPGREIASQHLREAGILTSEDQALHAVQQRRRSDSEFARQRDLGAGAARRNGVVEPDEVEAGDAPPQGSRSWLIYVVGTNLSEDHPAFATPSLFTDVSLLGPYHVGFLVMLTNIFQESYL